MSHFCTEQTTTAFFLSFSRSLFFFLHKKSHHSPQGTLEPLVLVCLQRECRSQGLLQLSCRSQLEQAAESPLNKGYKRLACRQLNYEIIVIIHSIPPHRHTNQNSIFIRVDRIHLRQKTKKLLLQDLISQCFKGVCMHISICVLHSYAFLLFSPMPMPNPAIFN